MNSFYILRCISADGEVRAQMKGQRATLAQIYQLIIYQQGYTSFPSPRYLVMRDG